ncbi:MAG: hypothetical protein EAZ25_25335 [Oscillatoriales cyanobacterium]|nr:MAG: hypothetical protein EAZ25_25335 [Oscillatoriales cyanobacterium]
MKPGSFYRSTVETLIEALVLAARPLSRAVSFSDESSFCRGSAPVPTLPLHDFVGVSDIGRALLAPPLQENETALGPLGGRVPKTKRGKGLELWERSTVSKSTKIWR